MVPLTQPTLQLSFFQTAVLWLLSAYKRILSPRLERHGIECRFTLSCSDYGRLAVEKYGALRGIAMTTGRLARCNPYNHGTCLDYP